MSLPASDTFAGSAFASLSASWTTAVGTWRITASGDKAEQTGSVDGTVWWNADAFGNDHYSQIVIGTKASSVGPGVRLSGTSGGTQNGYAWLYDFGLYKIVNGAFTNLAAAVGSINAGDTLKLEVTGTSIKRYLNGVLQDTTTDATHSTGAAGMYINNGAGGPSIDTFTGDNVAGSGGSTWGPALSHAWCRIVQR